MTRIAAGRVIRLGSADRILAYMGDEPFGPAFRREVEAFIAITRTKASLLGQEAVGDPCFVRRLRHGASPRLDTCDRVSAWMKSQSSEAERRAVRAAVEDDVPAVPVDCAKQWEAGMDDDAIYMGTRELAVFLGLSSRTLDRYRVSGGGPKFHKFGNRVRYARADVEAWAAERGRSGAPPRKPKMRSKNERASGSETSSSIRATQARPRQFLCQRPSPLDRVL